MAGAYNTDSSGMWRSLVARMVRDHEAASSNLAIPTRNMKPSLCAGFLISGREFQVVPDTPIPRDSDTGFLLAPGYWILNSFAL